HMERTAAIKQTFTPDEMYTRAQATLEQCLFHGVTHMRTQVEVDPNVGLLGFEVIEHLRQEYAWAIDLQPSSLPAGRLDGRARHRRELSRLSGAGRPGGGWR